MGAGVWDIEEFPDAFSVEVIRDITVLEDGEFYVEEVNVLSSAVLNTEVQRGVEVVQDGVQGIDGVLFPMQMMSSTNLL